MYLEVKERIAGPKGIARRLRRSGRIPAVIYGDGVPMSVSVDYRDWRKRFAHVSGNTIVQLKIAEKSHDVLIKDVQDDIISGEVRHIDFYSIKAGKKLNAMVPIHMEGTPPGVREGGIMEHKIDELEVECLPKDMPEQFHIDISNLNIGDSFHVREVHIPPGVEVRTDPNLTILVISHSSSTETEEVMSEEDLEMETTEEIEEK